MPSQPRQEARREFELGTSTALQQQHPAREDAPASRSASAPRRASPCAAAAKSSWRTSRLNEVDARRVVFRVAVPLQLTPQRLDDQREERVPQISPLPRQVSARGEARGPVVVSPDCRRALRQRRNTSVWAAGSGIARARVSETSLRHHNFSTPGCPGARWTNWPLAH